MIQQRIDRAFEVKGRVIVVTGAASGIGYELTTDLLSLGAHVVALDVDGAKLSQMSAAVGDRSLATICADIRRRMQVEMATDEVLKRFQQVDGLVNCAAVTKRYPAIDFPEEEWDRIVDINLKGTFLCCQAFGRQMVKQRGGKIVNFVSIAGLAGHRNSAAYQASKGGVVQLTRALAVEWAPYRINVNAIAPSIVMTPMQEVLRSQDPGFFDELVAKIPLGRAADPEEIVPSALFLLSPASDQVTGHILAVDGGYLAQ
jgi:NAD(P)-dependent dehydrogenase (short-subunit alcohol dehydrogenase family)